MNKVYRLDLEGARQASAVARRRRSAALIATGMFFLVTLLSVVTPSQVSPQSGLRSLKTVSVPAPSGIDDYVRDFHFLTVLGKALFWDVQAGSDNRVACATCHFHAGADHRRQNQLASTPDVRRPVPFNRVLTISDFPFTEFSNPDARESGVVRDTRLIAGSAGVPLRRFIDVVPGGGGDIAADPGDLAAPALAGLKVRQVTTRNTPSVINAALNVRNFHDGRASQVFTGLTPFGDSDRALNALIEADGTIQPHRVRLENASLASQAMGPPVNAVEMSYEGRSWPKIGKKMLPLGPLAEQQVAVDDSVLGELANAEDLGLRPDLSYADLVRATFRPEFWRSSIVLDASGRVLEGLAAPRTSNEYTQMEFNFPLFWGLAIQAYQATLISNDSRFDQFAEGRTDALTSLEVAGLSDFQASDARCTICHGGPEFTAASFTNVAGDGFDTTRVSAFGFFRIGVSPVADDIGAGGLDTFRIPLFPSAPQDTSRGTFKTPSLRNVELTGPYFHTGGAATLRQVLDFYRRHPDFQADGNLGPGLFDIEIDAGRRERLMAFMKALTDDRVRYERAPFDHPSLCVPNGHPESTPGVVIPDPSAPGAPLAQDGWALIPAVGRAGSAVPLQTFEELLLGIGNDGSRAHTMTTPCGGVGHSARRRSP